MVVTICVLPSHATTLNDVLVVAVQVEVVDI